MPISVVVGGQFGSEGKGKVAHFLAKDRQADIAVRVGGPNSGHTVIDSKGEALVFRHLPTACIAPGVASVIPPGSYISIATLMKEMKICDAQVDSLFIDPHAWIVTPEDEETETKGGLMRAIGSTGSGMGAALSRRISRATEGTFAKNVSELKPYLADTSELLTQALNRNKRIVVEGTQGFGLSLLHSQSYPHCTSRDTVAAAFVAEAGLSPMDVDEVVMVIRSFPIRVSGASGPLAAEIDWETITAVSGYAEPQIEYTSVTQKVRRVARFDAAVVKRAIAHNRPTCIAMNHIDYIDANCAIDEKLTRKAAVFLRSVEQQIGMEIGLLGFGRASLKRRDRREHTAIAV
jgi:adenylosuccinate synthase